MRTRDEVVSMRFNDRCASPIEFPNWHFAEVSIGSARQACAICHCSTPAGTIPYWYDDPERPQHALPLIQSMSPIMLGDYGAVLARGRNKSIFVALCKVISDLPDPLLTVQVIYWIEKRLAPNENVSPLDIRQALNAIELYQQKRRHDIELVFQALYGA